MFDEIIDFIYSIFGRKNIIPLHEPCFAGNEKKYVNECIDSTFVSSIGQYVNLFEAKCAEYTGAKHCIATVNGTSAIHASLLLAGVNQTDEVLTQPVTFIATVNAISYTGAKPVFIDIDKDTFGLSSEKLSSFLKKNTFIGKDGYCYNKVSKRKISACVPMHTFGHPCKIDEIVDICQQYNIIVIEDAAESIGSLYKGKHTGTFGLCGVLSFNGNKIVTTGGGGMIMTNNKEFAVKTKHITTTAKIEHKWDYIHDMVGYNYRLPNINAAIGYAQMENIHKLIEKKTELANTYKNFFDSKGITFLTEPINARSNYWLNGILFDDLQIRNDFLNYAFDKGIRCRPLWRLINKLEMYKGCQTTDLENSLIFENSLVNLPSSVKL